MAQSQSSRLHQCCAQHAAGTEPRILQRQRDGAERSVPALALPVPVYQRHSWAPSRRSVEGRLVQVVAFSLCLSLSHSVSLCLSLCISGWFRWVLGLVDVRWLAVALWNYMRSTLARTLPRRRQAQRPGAVASGSAVPSTPPVATAALTAEGTDWAKAAAADMARRNAPPSAPPSAPPAAPFRLAKGANTTG